MFNQIIQISTQIKTLDQLSTTVAELGLAQPQLVNFSFQFSILIFNFTFQFHFKIDLPESKIIQVQKRFKSLFKSKFLGFVKAPVGVFLGYIKLAIDMELLCSWLCLDSFALGFYSNCVCFHANQHYSICGSLPCIPSYAFVYPSEIWSGIT